VQRWLADIRALGRVVDLRWGLVRDAGGWCSIRTLASWLHRNQPRRFAVPGMCCGLMIDRATVSAVAVELGVSWHTVNTIAMDATAASVAAAGPDRLAGARIIGIDEHRHDAAGPADSSRSSSI
jgi:hypothetical protein